MKRLRNIEHTGPNFVEEKDGSLMFYPTRYPTQEIKDVLGGRWVADKSAWKIAPTSFNIECLTDWYGFEILHDAPDWVKELREGNGFAGFKKHRELGRRARGYTRWEDLFPYQKKAVEYLVCNPHHGCILDLPPGRGKTATSVVAARVLDARKILVVAPMTLGPDWVDAFGDWYGAKIDVKRATAEDPTPGPEVTICHHEVLQQTIIRDEDGKVVKVWVDQTGKTDRLLGYPLDQIPPFKPANPSEIKKWIETGPKKYEPKSGKKVPARERIVQARPEYAEVTWDAVMVDESILLKNRKAVKLKVLKQLCKYAHQVWLMSGSPTAQGRQDLFPQLNLIDPKSWSSYWRFAEFFCNVIRDQWGWSIQGDAPGVSIHTFLRDYIYIPNPKDLHELPDYHYWSPQIEMSKKQRKAFNGMLEDWCMELENGDDELYADNHLAQQTRLLQITSDLCNVDPDIKSVSSKQDFLIDLMKNKKIDTPLLVWTWWVPTGKAYAERIKKEFKDLRVAHVHGTMKREDKEGLIKAYKDGELDVLILQMNIGKYGHTLINTQTVYYADLTYDSDAAVQSLWRTRRVGLEHRPVLITPKLIDSGDTLIDQNLAGKIPSIAEASNADLLSLLRALLGIEHK